MQDYVRAYTSESPDAGFGRKAIKRDRSQNFCLWLKAAVQRATNSFCFTSSTGRLDAEFPLLEELRTKPGVPRPAAFDPKRN